MENTKLGVFIKQAEATVVVSSRHVAEVFEKKHFHILESIKDLECSEEFAASNFRLGSYKDAQNQERPEYFITRDGFTFLAMGFTGEKAARFKEAYIKAFNEMERQLRNNALNSGLEVSMSEFQAPRLSELEILSYTLLEFLEDYCEEHWQGRLSRGELFHNFIRWRRNNGVDIPAPIQAQTTMAMNRLAKYRPMGMFWKGVRIKRHIIEAYSDEIVDIAVGSDEYDNDGCLF